jgi:hypothetical protein
VAGQKYYFELYHKEGIGDSMVSLAWKTPGGSRELIPSIYLASYGGEANDQDDDYLKDDWELANGLNPADDGKSPGSKDGAYGDLDGDGLTNLEEQKFGSKANLADSNGNGVSDFDEANFYDSDVLAGDIGAFTTVATLPGDSYAASFGEWEKSAGVALQCCRRGYVEYPVTVPASGVYSLKFQITSRVDGSVDENYDFAVSINGTSISRKTITIPQNGTNHLAVLTPWLHAGETYQVRIFADNSYNFRRASVDSVEVLASGGADSNNNGIPDWVDIRLHKTNGFDKTAIYSKTSPATVEGNARYPGLLQTNGVTVSQAPDGRFFTEVPLTANSPTTLNFGFENNALTASASVQWLPTNLLAENNITIRQNDSLLLTAFDDAEQASLESYSLSASGQTANNTADQPTPIVFPTAGAQTITVTHTAADGSSSSRSVTVNVIPLVSIPAPLCVTGYPRTWTYPDLPAGAVVQIDSQITTWKETTANTYTLLTNTPENHPALIRLGTNGPILGSTEVKSVSVRSDDMTGNLAIESYPTYDVVELPVVFNGDLDTAEIRCEIIIGGVTFTDGSTMKSLYRSDFDEYGTTKFYFDKPISAHANCHRFSIWHNGTRVAFYN